jgi:adenylosuccinate lyase
LNVTQIHSLSPLDGRYAERLSSLNRFFSEYALIKYRVFVEVEYLVFFLQKTTLYALTTKETSAIKKIATSFDEVAAMRVKKLEDSCHHDVKAVEYYLQEELTKLDLDRLIPFIHFGLTSEDVNSCAYGLALTESSNKMVIPALISVIEVILQQAEKSATAVMLARTHGQPAVPTTLGKELIVFAGRLAKTLAALKNIHIEAKVSGAVGKWNAIQFVLPNYDWRALSQEFIGGLGLSPNLVVTQIIPAESYSELFQILVRINAITIDCSRDCWQYISDSYLVQQVKDQDVGSSTMPHKVNPIEFENSEGNAGIAIALLQHFIEKLPISRLQRDLSDSTVKRSFGTAVGHTLLALESLKRGLQKVSPNIFEMEADVMSHPEVLSEALQTAMRLNGIQDAYEVMKATSRGKVSTKADFVAAAQAITDTALRQKCVELMPTNYIGLAVEIVKTEVTRIQKEINRKD